MKDTNFPQTQEEFDKLKCALESKGFVVLTKWRKGIKSIKLDGIVLRTNEEK